jgi:hypothetical protein
MLYQFEFGITKQRGTIEQTVAMGCGDGCGDCDCGFLEDAIVCTFFSLSLHLTLRDEPLGLRLHSFRGTKQRTKQIIARRRFRKLVDVKGGASDIMSYSSSRSAYPTLRHHNSKDPQKKYPP